MKKIQQSKKDPERIRHLILVSAIELSAQKGVASVSIQAVADAVGITKGGVFHHFPNKQQLLDAMIQYIVQQIDHTTDQLIAQDERSVGCFTRAYIRLAFATHIHDLGDLWSALAMTMLTQETFNHYWAEWLKQKLSLYADVENSPELYFIRLATDGLWLQSITGLLDHTQAEQLQQQLIERTYLVS